MPVTELDFPVDPNFLQKFIWREETNKFPPQGKYTEMWALGGEPGEWLMAQGESHVATVLIDEDLRTDRIFLSFRDPKNVLLFKLTWWDHVSKTPSLTPW